MGEKLSTRDTVLSLTSAVMAFICGGFGAWAGAHKDGVGAAMVCMFLAGCFMGIFMMIFGRPVRGERAS